MCYVHGTIIRMIYGGVVTFKMMQIPVTLKCAAMCVYESVKTFSVITERIDSNFNCVHNQNELIDGVFCCQFP